MGHWLGILRADKTAIIHAAAKAEQAVTYLKAFAGDPKGSEDLNVTEGEDTRGADNGGVADDVAAPDEDALVA